MHKLILRKTAVAIVSTYVLADSALVWAQPAIDDYGILSVIVENDLFGRTDKG